jgi:transposase-like protein
MTKWATADDQALMINAYREGVTVKTIGERHGVTRETVHNVLRRHNVPRRRRPGPARKPFTIVEMARIAELRRAQWSKLELADEFRTSELRITRALAEMDFPKRMRRRDGKDRLKARGGYIYVLVPKDDPMYCMAGRTGYVFEHRLVMARAIGRPLLRKETVHHINGKTDENGLENLQLRHGQHGTGVVMVCNSCGSHDVKATQIADSPSLTVAS